MALFLLSVSLFLTATGQEGCFLQGIVKDKDTGEPLIGANVQCTAGTSTDVHGFFSLKVKAGENPIIKVSYVGYKDYIKTVSLLGDQYITIELEPGLSIEEINVTAIRRIEDRMETGTVEIPVQQIKTLPIIGEPDILKALQLMPGVQGGAEGRNGFYVRGGSPDQNLFMLDGTPLYHVNHLGGFVSVFHPGIIKNVKLYKGGFPARYGGRLSSVVDLRMKEGNKKEKHGSWGVGLVSGDFSQEGPINDKTSYIFSVRRMWLDLLTRPATKIGTGIFSMGYNFYDLFGKISHEANANNRYYLSLYGGDDRLGFNFNEKDSDLKGYSKYMWGNVLATCRWNHIYNPKLYSDITLFYTRYRYKLNQFNKNNNDKNRRLYKSGLQDMGVKADFNWHPAKKITTRFGLGTSGNWFKPGQITYTNKVDGQQSNKVVGAQNKLQALSLFVYLENEFHISKLVSFNIGLRAANLMVDSRNYTSFEPRALIKYRFRNSGAITAGYSRMAQAVHMLSYSGNSFPTDIWLPSDKNIRPSLSDQYSLSFTKSIENGKYELSAEAYYKELSHLLAVKGGVTLVNTQQWDKNVEKEGTGASKGLEFLVQKKQGRSTGWISYTLAKSDRQFANINNGKPYAFKYDRKHDFSVVFNHKLSGKVNFSATWVYGSGYPTTLHNGTYQAIEPVDFHDDGSSGDNSFEVTGEAYLYPGKNWLRMRDYHRLDIGFNFHKKKGKKERIWTLGIYNLYNRQNAVFYYFDHEDYDSRNPIVLYQQSGFPFIPTAKYSINF